MQFTAGQYRGCIFKAANHSEGIPQKEFMNYKAHGFYTDHHGKTAIATSLSGNRLMMNIRNKRGDLRARIVALSSNGGTN